MIIVAEVTRDGAPQAEDPEQGPDFLRHFPIGVDAVGARYFFFSQANEDCRLYREAPPKQSQEDSDAADFETVCTDLDQLMEFTDKLAESGHEGEQELHGMLQSVVLPALQDTVAARRRAEERLKNIENMRHKRSSRLQVCCWTLCSYMLWQPLCRTFFDSHFYLSLYECNCSWVRVTSW